MNPCPPDEPGADTINLWVLRAARACEMSGIPDIKVEPWISDAMTRAEKGREVVRAIAKAYSTSGNHTDRCQKSPAPAFNLEKLQQRAELVPFEVTDERLADVSPVDVRWTDSATYLDTVFSDDENVTIVHPMFAKSGTGFNYAIGNADDADLLVDYVRTNRDGVWYVSNAVNGMPDPSTRSVRSESNLTSYGHLVIESDHAKQYRSEWLAVLVQLQLKIKAIYESGSNPPSIHALVDIGATDKASYECIVGAIKPQLVALGACQGAFSALRLTRLPGAVRNDLQRGQRLLYLNPNPTGNPIYKGSSTQIEGNLDI